MSFLDWFSRQPKISPQPDMFIAHRETGVGVIMSAELQYSKATGKPYIRVDIAFSETDRTMAIVNRLGYTYFVLRNKLDTSSDATEFNIAHMVGMTAKVRFDYKLYVNDRMYVEAVILDTWRS